MEWFTVESFEYELILLDNVYFLEYFLEEDRIYSDSGCKKKL